MPSASTVASVAVGSIPRSARMPAMVLLRAPSPEQTYALVRDPRGRLRAVVVEQHGLHPGALDQLGHVAQAAQLRGLDHDHPGDRGQVAAGGVGQGQLLLVQRGELAHVAVESAVHEHGRTGVQPARRQHRAEGVEIRVLVGDDHLCRPHAQRVPEPYVSAIASISTRAPAGRPATCTVERAGGSLTK